MRAILKLAKDRPPPLGCFNSKHLKELEDQNEMVYVPGSSFALVTAGMAGVSLISRIAGFSMR